MDITYKQDGMFTRFFPESKAGEDVWRELAKEDGVASVLNHHSKSVIAQIRAAGYRVGKAKKSTQTINEILAEDDLLLVELAS